MRLFRKLPYSAELSAVMLLLVIAVLPLHNFMPTGQWHDSQRLGQIALFVIAAHVFMSTPSSGALILSEDSRSRSVIAALLIAGSISALSARHPMWGFAEIGIVVGCLGLAGVIVILRQSLHRDLDCMILATIFFICIALTLQFFVAYLAVVITGLGVIDPIFLLDGFSNPRFYGQFISLSLPILVLPILVSDRLRRFYLPSVIMLILWWAIAFSTGTRGTWLGMLIAAAILTFSGSAGRSWAKVHLLGASLGLAICFLWLNWLPNQLGLSAANSSAARITASLSLREVIWQQAIDMILAKPLLGFGPMHFADVPNSIAGHPHQAFLQWSCEWGLPSAVVVACLVSCALRSVFHVVCERCQSSEEVDVLRICLLAAVLASITQSMVDGVLVMPYTETWLALIGGWLFAIHPHIARTRASTNRRQRWVFAWRISLAVSVALLVFISVRDFQLLQIREERYAELHGEHLKPRFWAQGMIYDE